MNFRIATTAGVLLLGLGSSAVAEAPKCLDRPTPPPCCADGRCYPNPVTWGWYETRWRRWPIESLEPTAAGNASPEQLQKLVPPFDAPSPEDEDRRAPPPTPPREEPATGGSTSGESDSTPRRESGTPPTAPLRPPVPPEPVGPRRTLPPYEPQTPSRSGGSTGPTGRIDPPPTPPFAVPAMHEAADAPQVKRLPAPRVESSQRPVGVNATSDDPPPPLPGILATAVN